MAHEYRSQNYGPRIIQEHLPGICMLVLHYTGMESCSEALQRLCDPDTAVSAHLLIDEDGTVHRLVADAHRAWHAGHAYWHGVNDVNSASVGIELVNPGHDNGYRPFPALQIAALIDTAQALIIEHRIPAWGICGHSDVAPGRKIDPGEFFPWRDLAAQGIGIWPKEDETEQTADAWADLAAIGYAVPGDPARGSKILDPESATSDVVSAFQRRFRPAAITGKLDQETRRLIRGVRAEIT